MYGSARGYLGHEVAPVGTAVGLRGREQHVAVGHTERTRHRAGRTNVTSEAAGVDPGDARDLMAFEVAAQTLGRAPVRRTPRQVTHDHAPAVRRPRFVVVAVDAVVADVRIGEGDDLTRVRRIGDDLLVAGRAPC